MIEASCHCGAVRLKIADAPREVVVCNCSICRRLGAIWTYFPPTRVSVSGATSTYIWGDRSIAFRRCQECGCTTHWRSLDPARDDRMGVNARMLPPEAIAGLEVRKVDGASR